MTSFRHDLFLYVWLVVTAWLAYAEAATTALLIYLIERASGKSMSWRLLGYAGIAFLVFAFFNVWRDQYQAGLKAGTDSENVQKKLEKDKADLVSQLTAERDKSQPNCSIKVSRFGALPGEQSRTFFKKSDIDSIALTEIVIGNSGTPSAAFDWRCELTRDGKTYQGWVFIIGDKSKMTFGDEHGIPRFELTKGDFIQEKTSNIPLSTGERKVGWVGAAFTGVSKEQLYNPMTEIKIWCEDVTGKIWSLSYHPTGINAERLGYEPGGVAPINP